jgi:thioredoxin reductase (NADPH)
MKTIMYDLVVVGAGIAGLVTARNAARGGLSTLLIESLSFGGLVTNVIELDGDVKGCGADVATEIMMEACDLGTHVKIENVSAIETLCDRFVVVSDQGRHEAHAVVAASGATLRALSVPGEELFTGRGVSHCADCDGPFFRDKDVVVIGGGDAALQSALLLAQICRNVNLVHRRDRFKARPDYVKRVDEHPRIQLTFNARVTAVVGGITVEALEIVQDGVAGTLPCHGVFPFIGLQPAGGYLPQDIKRDDCGHVIVDGSMASSIRGMFAAGALRAGYAGQVANAVADGERAAAAVKEFLSNRELKESMAQISQLRQDL